MYPVPMDDLAVDLAEGGGGVALIGVDVHGQSVAGADANHDVIENGGALGLDEHLDDLTVDNTQTLGIAPDVILGDFDSLGYVPEGAQVFPVEKDDTDAMLAVRQGLRMGYREFLLYGSLDGPRLDHTVSNFQTLQFLADHGAQGHLIGNNYIVTLVKNGTIRFPAEASGKRFFAVTVYFI